MHPVVVSPRRRSRLVPAALAAVPALLFPLAPAAADSLPAVHRVSAPALAASDVVGVPAPRFSPDGKWAVYVQDAEIDGAFELWSVRRWPGSVPVRLSAALPTGRAVADFAIAPDSSRVVFLADQSAAGKFELWTVPIDGSTSPAVLNQSLPSGGQVVSFALAPDGSRVVYLGDVRTDNQFELWSVPPAGPGAQRRQCSPDPQTAGNDVEAYTIASDAQHVIFAGLLRNNGVDELWSAPITCSSVGARISPVPSNGALGIFYSPGLEFRTTADGSRVIFAGDFQNPGPVALWTVPAGGPATSAHLLSPPPPPGAGGAAAFEVASGVNRVVLRGDLFTAGVQELWSVAADGSGSPQHISSSTPQADGDVTDFVIASGSSPQVAFRGDQLVDQRFDVYRVSINGGGQPVRLNATTVATAAAGTDLAFSPDGQRILFRGDFATSGRVELWSASSSGGAGSAVRLNPASVPTGGNVDAFAVDATSARVVFAGDVAVDGRRELWTVPVAGPGSSAARLHPAAAAGEGVAEFELSPDGSQVAFLAALRDPTQAELWIAPVAGPAPAAPVHDPPVTGGNATAPLAWADDSLGVLFLGDLATAAKFELWDADVRIFRADFEGGDTAEWSAAVE
jgi:dipeptidyl aminopeptidase/acylaminoacyl peptidase